MLGCIYWLNEFVNLFSKHKRFILFHKPTKFSNSTQTFCNLKHLGQMTTGQNDKKE